MRWLRRRKPASKAPPGPPALTGAHPGSAPPGPGSPEGEDRAAEGDVSKERDPIARAAADLAAGRKDTDCYGAARETFSRTHRRRSR